MAGCERRFGILQIIILSLVHSATSSTDLSPKFKDFLPNVLDRHIKVSRHLPVCVIYRKPGEGSPLEDVVHELWKGDKQNFTSWEFGSYSFGKNTKLHYRNPSTVPLLRCFLGLTSHFDYTDEPSKYKINHWLHRLARTLEDQLQDATETLVDKTADNYKFTVVAFPDHARHSEIEEMAFQVTAENLNCKAYISHMHSIDNRKIRLKYNVNEVPSIIIIYRKDTTKTVHHFSKQQMTVLSLDIFIKSRSLPVPHYSLAMFERDVIKSSVRIYTPKILTFYAYWSPGIYGYLSALNRTIEEFCDLDVEVHFGLVDITDDTADSRKIVNRWISSRIAQQLPFTLIYYKDSNKTIQQRLLTEDRPTPMSVYNWLSTYKEVAETIHLPLIYQPYGVEDPNMFTYRDEGPYGCSCYLTSHNQTVSTPQQYWWTWRIHPNKQRQKKTETQKSWHDVFGTENINKKLEKVEDIPLLSHLYWSEVVEKSHAPLHPFMPGREWAGEVTKVALIIFIMADCRSCKKGMETFKNLQNSVKYIAGGSIYLVNCTEEVELCKEHDIRGFPTVTAFRGLGWLDSSTCISDESQRLYKSYRRMDYHGVLQAKPIMVWFGEIASSAVKDRLFDWPKQQLVEDVRLVGVLVPKASRFLPIPQGRKQNYYFSYECYRLICERLYGKATCYSVYSKELPQIEFKQKDLDVVVSKIILQRKDGVDATLMQIGHTLSQSLENQQNTKLHMFHKTHRYKIGHGQKCETDHAACTDIITAFTLDHSRLPITQINSNAFHTSDSLDSEDLPILIALVYKDNITDTASFSQVLTEVAYQFYNDIIVMTLDAEEFPAWAGQFLPLDYTKIMIKYDGDPKLLFDYPRVCMVKKNDHTHAAFYPPLDQDRWSVDWFEPYKLKQFILDYLDDPSQNVIETEHF
ncbi:uncharacterized protein LOC143064244 isoform X1 [Mytilus galloprovincialis]|uniref:uncharacterized protein LOC143064244 isoform X1 n=1 Tax=Mytilus galloprovincialis TaxID=29158 RepID=UPI003F7C28E7